MLITTDSEKDEIRRVTVENVKVAFIKRSNEKETFYKDSIIVVAKNETSAALDA